MIPGFVLNENLGFVKFLLNSLSTIFISACRFYYVQRHTNLSVFCHVILAEIFKYWCMVCIRSISRYPLFIF